MPLLLLTPLTPTLLTPPLTPPLVPLQPPVRPPPSVALRRCCRSSRRASFPRTTSSKPRPPPSHIHGPRASATTLPQASPLWPCLTPRHSTLVQDWQVWPCLIPRQTTVTQALPLWPCLPRRRCTLPKDCRGLAFVPTPQLAQLAWPVTMLRQTPQLLLRLLQMLPLTQQLVARCYLMAR